MASIPILRIILGLMGLLVAQVGYWASGARITVFTLVFGVLSAAPYVIYTLKVQTRLVTLGGGLALILIPAVPYADTYFLSPGAGASFAFVTVPIAAVAAVAVLVAVDDWLLTRQARQPDSAD